VSPAKIKRQALAVSFLLVIFFFCIGLLTFLGDLRYYTNKSTFEALIFPGSLKEYSTIFRDVTDVSQLKIVDLLNMKTIQFNYPILSASYEGEGLIKGG
jgi:hypothetical protein